MRATRAIIHLDNLRHNLGLIGSAIGRKVKVCLAVKADAYGHGAVAIAREAERAGVDFFGVANVEEGLELRCAGIRANVLLLSIPLDEEIRDLVSGDIIPIVSATEHLGRLSREALRQRKRVSVHLKVDTGMGRLGIRPDEAVAIAKEIASDQALSLGGVCTHFPSSDSSDPGDSDFTRAQVRRFTSAVDGIRAAGIDPGIVHAANSGAVIAWADSLFDMVRPGILAYGYYPSCAQDRIYPVKPVMELATKIVLLKRVPAGTPISYGMTYKPLRDTIIATLPVGYGDGYSRALSNKGEVCISGMRFPIAGRVCMDHTMVDLGPDSSIPLYSDVTLFGPDAASPDAEELASLMGTIPYEVTCLITKRVPRVYVGGDAA